MKYKESTFDKLVKTISTDEAQKMLSSIKENVGASNYNFEDSKAKIESSFSKNLKGHVNVSDEPFILRIIFHLLAFFSSTTVNAIHNKYLLRQLASELKKTAKSYYSPTTNIFTNAFYLSLKELRRTQLFFSGLLQAYDSEKGEFYIILSSFIASDVYQALLQKTDPLPSLLNDDTTKSTRANMAKDVDNILTQLSESQKTALYECAKSIEWIKNLCDASLDKPLLKFSGPENELTCLATSILTEMQVLTSVLNSARKIPDEVIQTLFLLYNKENLAINAVELAKETEKFKTDATKSLNSINQFIEIIPMVQILRYVGKDVSWMPLKLEAGEDWYIFFKHAWKDRLTKKWDEFTLEQEKSLLRDNMKKTLEVETLEVLSYEPWVNMSLDYSFSKQLTMEFIKTIFKTVAPYFVQILNVIAINGIFIRKENGTEFLDTFNNLQQFGDFVQSFEAMLSPEGEIGAGFDKLRQEKVVGLTYKKNLDILLKSVETNARQIITNCSKIFQSLYAIFNGIFTGGKKGLYATLSNFDKVNGNKTDEYKEKLKKVYSQISQCLAIFDKLEKLEK